MSNDIVVNLDTTGLAKLDSVVRKSLAMTAEQVHTDVVQSQTMPFKTGQLQNDSTFVDMTEFTDGHVMLVTSTPYARRLYFHPEYNFSKDENPIAGADWFGPYADGGEKNAKVKNWFKQFMKMNGG